MQNAQRAVFAVVARCPKLAQITGSSSCYAMSIATQTALEIHPSSNFAGRTLQFALTASFNRLSGFQGCRGFAALKELTMPALSPTMTQGDIVEWKISEKGAVAPGDVFATVQTDKAVLEWESQEEGFLAKILVPGNSKDVQVGSVVALLADDEEDIAQAASYVIGGGPAPTAAAPAAPAVSTGQSTSNGNFPPHTMLKMPALSPTMNSGDIATWSKAVGDSVAPGDVLCEVGTDKATMAWEAQEEGFLAAIFRGNGSKDVKVGDPVALIVDDESAVAAFAAVTLEQLEFPATPPAEAPKPSSPAAAPQAVPLPKAADAPIPKPAAIPSTGDRVPASPFAKKLAKEAGLDLHLVKGSGPGGRIVASDVEQAIAQGLPSGAVQVMQPSSPFTDVQLNQIKRVTARRLLESKQTIPHYYLTMACNVDGLMEVRKQVNTQCEKLGLPLKISVNDFIIRAAALALKKVPSVNASWMGDFIRQYNNVDISVAVMTPAGLMVPVIRSADKLGVQSISSTVKGLAQKARNNQLKPEELSGGTFTVSNLGMYGVKQFAAIVNPPQSAILAVGAPQKTVALADGSNFRESTVLEVTLSCDHRVVDGAVGAEWLQAFKSYMENPYGLLV